MPIKVDKSRWTMKSGRELLLCLNFNSKLRKSITLLILVNDNFMMGKYNVTLQKICKNGNHANSLKNNRNDLQQIQFLIVAGRFRTGISDLVQDVISQRLPSEIHSFHFNSSYNCYEEFKHNIVISCWVKTQWYGRLWSINHEKHV